MKNTINSNLIAANSFLSTYQDVLSKEQVTEYVAKASSKINDELDMVIDPFDIDDFIKQYNTIVGVDMHEKDIFLRGNNDIRVLIDNIRKTLPVEVKEILDETGRELMREKSNKVYTKR